MPNFNPTGPISLQGAPTAKVAADLPAIGLRVLNRGQQRLGEPVGLSQQDLASLHACEPAAAPAHCMLQLGNGSDCVLSARLDTSVVPGTVLLDEVTAYNLHILAGDTHKFRVFQAPENEPFDLVDLEVEVRLLHSSGAATSSSVGAPATGQGLIQVEYGALVSAFGRACFGRVVSCNERFVLPVPGWEGLNGQAQQLVLRITAANTLSAEEAEEAVGYHCFRGRLTPQTAIFMHAQELGRSQAEGLGAATQQLASMQLGELSNAGPSTNGASGQGQLVLLNKRERAQRPPPTNTLNIYTSDGEWFPVKKNLLRPCIALTKVVRDESATAPSTSVDIDTLTFDRVLVFLEAHVLGRDTPQWSLHLLDDLKRAGQVLGLQPLVDYCDTRLGRLAGGLKLWTYEEVIAANASGKVVLILDGMVLDVTRWLPEHPGGAKIIPAQSLNMDCSRFFEIYHASRESFLYLRDFYQGELLPEERARVPMGRGGEMGSPDFMAQLREFTQWRLHVSSSRSTHLHLGAR